MSRNRRHSDPPIPISEEILRLARGLKEGGLDWEPEVGHFVWDPNEVIESPSPFPLRVYFILNLKRFLSIFGSIDSMKSNLIWLPTPYQLKAYASREDLAPEFVSNSDLDQAMKALSTLMNETIQPLRPEDFQNGES